MADDEELQERDRLRVRAEELQRELEAARQALAEHDGAAVPGAGPRGPERPTHISEVIHVLLAAVLIAAVTAIFFLR